MQVLIVEDDPDIRRMYEQQIRSYGHEVTACEDAQSALEAYQQNVYPLIIVDLGLPGIDGREFCCRIRSLPQGDQSMILVITGHDKLEDLQAALDAGADDYLTKPVNMDALQVRLHIIEQQFQNRLQRKQAEDEVCQQRAFLEHILESLPDPFYVIDPNSYTVTLANSAARQNKITERATCHVLMHNNTTPCDETKYPCPIRQVKRTKQPAIVEHVHYESKGNARYHEVHAYPIFDAEGNVVQIIEYSIDVTNRKRVEQELQDYREHLEVLVEQRTAELQQINTQLQQEITERQRIDDDLRTSEQQYRLLVESVKDGIGIIQGQGKQVFVNDALAEMFGYTSEELLTMDPLTLFHDDFKPRLAERFEMLLKGEPVDTDEVICITKDGREIWVEEDSRFITWEGEFAVLTTMRDITERKLREIAMEEEKTHLQKENINLRTTARDRYKFGEIIGKSPLMQEIYELLAHTAATDANVVISGESGTGKELIATTIHQLSDRRDHPFVPVNCGAIPENLFEREFFGHRKGAFTGADQNKAGYFDQAHQGTLFLDEVGELSPLLQVKLLRAIDQGEYMPVGSNTPKTVDVRIVAATNRDLEKQVQQGLIRKDFFFRLNVISITVPPLRDRKEDIPLLIDHFLDQYRKGPDRPTLPGHVLQRLYHHDWSGNIRELQNVLQRYLTVNRLEFPGSRHIEQAGPFTEGTTIEIDMETLGYQEALEAFEKQFLLRVLEQYRWRKTQVAQALGIGRKTLYRKMKQFGLL